MFLTFRCQHKKKWHKKVYLTGKLTVIQITCNIRFENIIIIIMLKHDDYRENYAIYLKFKFYIALDTVVLIFFLKKTKMR